jgi:DNA-nicking Smr family endonuclease
MPRKKRKKRRVRVQALTKKEPGPFYPAFEGLGRLKDKHNPAVGDPEQKRPLKDIRDTGETRCFLEAMRGVQPLTGSKNTVPRTPDPGMRPSHRAPDDELEAMTKLSDLVAGTAEMDITFSDEYIEGSARGFSRKLMRKLKKGQFPIQDHIDLHGLTRQEAKMAVRDFLIRSHGLGLRCLLVVHGRGLNSENHIPVLKEQLPTWLSRGPVRRIVLAFSTAMPYDGGTGAVYILLRKGKGSPLQVTPSATS